MQAPVSSGYLFRHRTAFMLSAVIVTALLAAPLSQAATLYWDANGITTGSGVTPTGTWGTSTFWSTDSNGAATTAAYASGSDVVFSAGSDATGAYTVTLSGTQLANSITFEDGATTITAGTSLQIAGGGINVTTANPTGVTISSTIALTASQNWMVAGGTSLTSTTVVSGAFALTKTGTGTLTLKGTNTFNGGFTVANGTAIGTATAAFGTGPLTLGDISGSNDASLLLNTASAFTSAITVASGSSGNTFTLGSVSGGSAITASGAISLGHDLVVTDANANITTLSGIISETGGARALAVNAGQGTIAITNNNTFSGGVTLNNGRLQVGALNSTGTGTLTIAGGILDNSSTSVLAVLNNSAYLWNADFVFAGSFSLTLGTGGVTLSGNRVVTTNIITNSVLAVSGPIDDGGNGYSLTKAGAGTLTLNGANTYSGATNVTKGILNLTGAGSSLANTSAVNVTGGTLNEGVASGAGVANRINPATTLTLGGSGIFTLNAGASGPVNSQSFAALAITAGSTQFGTNSATNSGTLTLTGAGSSAYTRAVGGTVRFVVGTSTSFTNTPTGSSTIGAGSSAILIGAVTGASATTTSSTDFVKAAAGAVAAPTYGTNIWSTGVNTDVTAAFSASGNTQSLRFNTTANLTTTLTGVSTLESGGILVSSNALGGGTITGGTLQAASGQDLWIYASTLASDPQGLTINSLVADNGTSSLTKSGGGKLFLTNAANTYAGGTFLGEGTLNITSSGTLGTGALNFTGNATLQGNATSIDLGTRAITIASGQTAFFDPGGAANTLISSGVISGTGGLTKTGLGTLTLSGANTYTGVTAIDNGTLKLDFSAAGAPTSNIINSSSLFSPGGGSFIVNGAFSQTVIIQGKDATANSQTFGGAYTSILGNPNTVGTYLNKGMSHLDFIAGGSGGTLTVNLGTITRGFSNDPNDTLDINIGAGVTVLAGNATGLLGGYATVNENTWVTVSSGTITGLATASYSTSYGGTAGLNLDVGTGGTLSTNPNTMRFDSTSAAIVVPGASIVRQITGGGILVTANVGANTSTIAGGALTGISARDLIIHQNNTAGVLEIDASVVDFGARTMAISKDGAGTLVLTAANTYTGLTYVNEGTLVATGDTVASFTQTATSIAGNATITMSNTSGIFIGQAVTGAALTTGSTTWTVVAINPGVSVTLSNTVTASSSGGSFTFGAAGALGAGVTTHYVAPGATLQLGNGGTTGSLFPGQVISDNGAFIIDRSSDLAFTNVINGTGTFEKQGASNVTLSAADSFTGDTRISGGSLILSTVATNLQGSTLDYNNYGGTLSFGTLTAATLGGLKGGQNLALINASAAAVTLTVGANNQDSTYSGALSGAGALTKTGGGALTLSGTNTYTGATSSTQGTLNMAGSFTNAGIISVSAGVLNMPGTFTDAGGLAVSGSGILNMSGNYTRTVYSAASGFTATGGTANITGTLGSASVPLGQTAFSGNSVTNFSGTEFMVGASSTFRIGDASSATVNVTGGTLTLAAAGSGLILGRTNATASGFLNISGGSVVLISSNTAVRVGAGFVDAESSGASILSISGTGLLTTGTTTGTFLLGSNLAGNSTSTGTLNLDGGMLSTLRAITGGSVGASTFNFNGGTFQATGATATLSTTLTTANVRNGGAVIDTNGFNIAIAKALTHSAIAGDNATDGGLTKNSAGTLTLSGANTYTGATTVNAGTLKAGVATTAFGNNSAVTLANTAGATLDITGFNNTIGSLSGGGSTGGNVTLGAATLTVGGNNAGTTYAGVISGTGGSLTKTGSGTLALSGANNYTGSTTVSAGTLQVGVAGAGQTGSGITTVNGATAVLAGTGTVQGVTTVTVGQVQPGDNGGQGIGTLSFANGLTFNSASPSTAAAMTIQGTSTSDETGDRISITGSLTLNASSNFVVTPGANWVPTVNQSWTLMDWTGLLSLNGWSAGSNLRTGNNASLNEGNLDLPDISSSGFLWNVSALSDGGAGGALSIIIVAPEPSRALLLLTGFAFAFLRRRR